MTSSGHRPFTAERRKADLGNSSLGMADVLGRIEALEKSINTRFDAQFKKLCDRLDVIVEDDSGTSVAEIMIEIESMNDHINMTKHEVAALKPIGQDNTTLTIATEELSEVVQSTEDAANTILENTEKLDMIVSEMRGKVSDGDPDGVMPDIDKIEYISMELLTACSFQDVTGQRITKVVNSLNFIEERLNKMIEIWRIEHGTANIQEIALPKGDTRIDKDMLHGPQSTGMNQEDIDSLFD